MYFKSICLISVLSLCCSAYAHNNEWVSVPNIVCDYPVVEVPTSSVVTYTTEIRTPAQIYYRLMPIYYNQINTTTHHTIFGRKQTITYVPTIVWVYQPYIFR